MEQERKARYQDKMAHADKRLQQAEGWLDASRTNEAYQLGRYKAFQEAVEATTDLAAMILADLGEHVRDDYRNFEKLSQLGIASGDILSALAASTGLRNRLVHEYNELDPAKADAAIGRLAPSLRQSLQEVERWLQSAK